MPVELRCDCPGARRFAPRLLAQARRLMRQMALEDCELSIALVDDRAIRRLNRRYRDRDHATDVLSFSQLEEATANGRRANRFLPKSTSRRRSGLHKMGPTLLGDVAISLETASRQALRMRIPTPDRLQALLIHGFLHILGYDHERSRSEAALMFERERELAAGLSRGGSPPSSMALR